MKNHWAVSLLALLSYLLMPANGQTAAVKSQGLPRTFDGKPDFSGVWATPGFKHVEGAKYPDIPTPVGFNTKDLPPFQPGGEQLFNRKLNGTAQNDDPELLCLPNGFPRMALTPHPLRFLHGPGYVLMLYEYQHFTRVIPTDGRAHPKNPELTWLGDSVGKWDGDTLVIDTVGLKPWDLDARNHMHTDALHVIERLQRTGATTMAYEITLDDPKIFTRPWSQSFVMHLRPDWTIEEDICEENNKDPGLVEFLNHPK